LILLLGWEEGDDIGKGMNGVPPRNYLFLPGVFDRRRNRRRGGCRLSAQPAVNVVLIILALPLAGFLLLMGVANLIQPDVADKYLLENTIMCILVCTIGLGLLLTVVAAFRGILHKIRDSRREHQT